MISVATQEGDRMGVLEFKQAVLDELWGAFVNCPLDSDRWVIDDIRQRVERLPVSEQEEFEWCTDCKEYDPEKHCCHRFAKVIRRTVEEMKIVHCWECKYRMPDGHCSRFADSAIYLSAGDYCSYGEKRGGVSK